MTTSIAAPLTRSTNQASRAADFHALHQAAGGFIIPNPYDAGTARLLEHLGFKALATTSAGFAFSRGRPDNGVARDDVLAHLRDLSTATSLPISADLENGFGDDPAVAAETILLAAEAGVVGGSVEDTTGRPDDPLYSIAVAAERVRAAAEAARSLPFQFTLTARAENHFIGRQDLKDTIARLQAYQDAGADVLYAPGLTRREDIKTVLRHIDRPLNVLMGLQGMTLDAMALIDMGVKRVSVGGSLARAALGGFMKAAEELMAHGTTSYASTAPGAKMLNETFSGRGGSPR